MYYFPKRPIDKRGFYRRRSWNSDIHRYDDVVAHYDAAQCCYADEERQVPCQPGDSIEAAHDLGPYGHHAKNAGTSRYLLVIDNGFAAIQTTNSTAVQLMTTVSFPAAMQVVVCRSAEPSWNGHGAVFGGTSSNRWYLFHNSGTGFHTSPQLVQRQNGQAQHPGDHLSNIHLPMVLTFGHRNAAVSTQQYIGRNTHSNSLFVYEILAFSSILDVEDIEQIEAYLMDKYGIG